MLSRYLLPRLNPYALLGQFSALVVLAEVVLVEQRWGVIYLYSYSCVIYAKICI